MGKKKTPQELIEQANRLKQKAKQVEHSNNAKLGSLVREIANDGFKCTYDEFMQQIKTHIKGE